MNDALDALGRALLADVHELDAVGRNVANMQTPGYRAQRPTVDFRDAVETVGIDLRSGPLQDTGRPLDIALRGAGFLTIVRDGRQLLTRFGQLEVGADGLLRTAQGDLVLGRSGSIRLGDRAVEITGDGNVMQGGDLVDRLAVVNVSAGQLLPVGGDAFRATDVITPADTGVVSGALEGSNVDPAEETIRLIALSRHAESTARAMALYDKTMDVGINRIGEN